MTKPPRDMLQKGLPQGAGFSVEVAQNCLEAIEKTYKDVCDLAGVEIRRMDGFNS